MQTNLTILKLSTFSSEINHKIVSFMHLFNCTTILFDAIHHFNEIALNHVASFLLTLLMHITSYQLKALLHFCLLFGFQQQSIMKAVELRLKGKYLISCFVTSSDNFDDLNFLFSVGITREANKSSSADEQVVKVEKTQIEDKVGINSFIISLQFLDRCHNCFSCPSISSATNERNFYLFIYFNFHDSCFEIILLAMTK